MKWGFIDRSGAWVIPPQYEHAMPHMCGLAAVKVKGLYGYIDLQGHLVIPPEFEDFGLFRQNRCSVLRNGRPICIDPTGKKVFDNVFKSSLEYLDAPLARAKHPETYLYGFIDLEGRVAISFRFFLAEQFHEGLASVAKKREEYWFIDTQGNELHGPYQHTRSYDQGHCGVMVQDAWRLVDRQGKLVFSLPEGFTLLGGICDGRCSVSTLTEKSKYGFVDPLGKVAIPFEYEHAWPFCDGRAVVKKKGKYGLIDPAGKAVCRFQYDYLSFIAEGFVAFQRGDLHGYLDLHGQEVIPAKFQLAHDFSMGLAAVAIQE